MLRLRLLCLAVLVISCGSCGKGRAPAGGLSIEDAYRELSAGNQERGIEILSEYLTLHPDNIEALRMRGGARLVTGDLDGALEDLNRALAIDNRDGVALNNRAYVFREMGQRDKAIADFEDAIAAGFDNADLRCDLAILYSLSNDRLAAVRHYSHAIRLDPENTTYLLNRGACLVDLGRFAKGIDDFTRAIELAPDDYRPYALRCNAYSELGEFEKAQRDWEQAHQLNPEWPVQAAKR